MILDSESYDLANAIESLLEEAPDGEIKPELMESVLEIATKPAANTREAGAQPRAPPPHVSRPRPPPGGPRTAHEQGTTIGAAGTPPFARGEDQRIAARHRYRELVAALRFVA